jgi:hypothetical protein
VLILGFLQAHGPTRARDHLLAQMHRWATAEGWTLGTLYAETPGSSAFDTLLSRLKRGEAKGVLIPSIAHLGTDAGARLALLTEAGVGIYFLAPPP